MLDHRIAFVALVMAASTGAFAQTDTVTLAFRQLSIQDGLSQGMVSAIAQDRWGFMWFATKDGLNRYDGYSFRVFRHDPQDSTTIVDNHILWLLEDRRGWLWVSTNKGLDVFDPSTEVFHHIPCSSEESKEGGRPMLWGCSAAEIVEDQQGRIWVITDWRLHRITLSASPTDPLGEGLMIETVFRMPAGRMTIDRKGILRVVGGDTCSTFFINTNDGGTRVRRMDADRFAKDLDLDPTMPMLCLNVVEDTIRHRTYAVHGGGVVEFGATADELRAVVRSPQYWYPEGVGLDAAGAIWVCSRSRLYRCDPVTGQLAMVQLRGVGEGVPPNVSCIYRDRSGVLWLGTPGYGVLTYDPFRERFHPHPSTSVRWMMSRNDGRALVAAGNAAFNCDPRKPTGYTISTEDRISGLLLQSEHYPSIIEDRFGSLWWNERGVLTRYDEREGTKEHFSSPGPVIFPLHLDGDTLVSFGSDSAFIGFDTRTHRFEEHPYPIPPVGGVYLFLQSIHRDAQGIFWLGTMKGLLRFDHGKKEWRHYANVPGDPRSLPTDVVFCLQNDPNDQNALWIGTSGGGLNRMDKRTGQFTHFGVRNGLPNEVIYGLLTDDDGQLWMSTNKGIARFDPYTHEVRNFDASDGLPGDEFNRYAFCKTVDGTLFFGGVDGFTYFHPRDLKNDQRAVQVAITDIKLHNRSIAFGRGGSPLALPSHLAHELIVPYGEASMLTFDFASMDYGAIRNRQYQYQLMGFDPERINTGLTRTANYTNLDPGEYTFKVWGRNRDGVWNMQPTILLVRILPPWYMTAWARVLAVLMMMASVLTYIQVRTRSLRRQRDQLEESVRQRTGELNAAKERSDELLHNILPEEVADELKAKGEADARQIDQVTVLFTDFKDFTAMSEKLTPRELVRDIHECFSAFDHICTEHGIEKIKTIGDAYMAAGGLPTPNTTHATDAVNAALEIRDFIDRYKAQKQALGLPYFEVRVGVHTGPVVAGIVGVRKFQYDIWGDTVNTANRMESSGEPGEVNISGATHALVKDRPEFLFTSRGRVSAKGKGEMEMYFVTRA